MEVLWQRGPATVHQVMNSLPQSTALAYNSVLTTIRILEKKGYVRHLKDGRAHVYEPLVGRKEATRSEVRNLLSRFFKDSHELLMLDLLEDQSIDADGLRRLRELLGSTEPAGPKGGEQS